VIKIGAPREKTRVLTAGIDFNQFDPNINPGAISTQYGITKKDVVLFFMGWLYQFSGLKEAATELAKLRDKHVKLLVVGEGDAYEELKQIREKFDMQDRLILVGRKPYSEIPAFIAASDICLLPAYPTESIMRDIVPIKIYEYMAMRKPVISTRLPGVIKEFREGHGVVYVDKPEDVIQKAMELIKQGNLNTLGTKARAYVERYRWEEIADQFERILKETVKKNREKSHLQT
jgi:glycosyltransferase involved in cell wall biosynthesis